MVRLDFELALVAQPGYLEAYELEHASETALRYSGCTGILQFFANDANFSIAGVSLLDFAAGLGWVVKNLKRGSTTATYDFPDGEGELTFSKLVDMINIQADYTTAVGQTSLNELDVAAAEFAARLLKEAIAAFPSIANNSSLKEWYPPQQ